MVLITYLILHLILQNSLQGIQLNSLSHHSSSYNLHSAGKEMPFPTWKGTINAMALVSDWHLQQEMKYSTAFKFKVIRHRLQSKVLFSALLSREAGQRLSRQQQDTLC